MGVPSGSHIRTIVILNFFIRVQEELVTKALWARANPSAIFLNKKSLKMIKKMMSWVEVGYAELGLNQV